MKFYGDLSSEISEREKEHYALAREAAAEGIVLLKNDNALPVRQKRVALYGLGAVKTVSGGTGSGVVNYRYAVNIRDGLKNAGISVTTEKYLCDCEKEFKECYQAWHESMEEKISCLSNPYAVFDTIGQFEFKYPYGRLITSDDISSETDTAIYVLMRQAGEGNDRKKEKGDYYINETERNNLLLLSNSYKHLILIINVGGMIDLSFTEDIRVDAIVYYTQGGMEGANALGDLLCGKINFSGKLADSWAKKYEDIPFGDEYSYLNGNLEKEFYREGIYVGYRYFDSFAVKPRYPFGFGLSYTDFLIKAKKIWANGSEIKAEINVKNCGGTSGKEVVQLYVTHLKDGKWKVYQQLVAFAKTGNIDAGKEETLSIGFDMKNCAVYSPESAAWILEKGEYLLRVGNSSVNTFVAAVVSVDDDRIVEKCKNCCAASEKITSIRTEGCAEIPQDVPRISLNLDQIKTVVHDYDKVPCEYQNQRTMLANFTTEEVAELVRGGDLVGVIKGKCMSGSGGKTTTALLDKGIPNIVLYDGPAGLNIYKHVLALPNGTEITVEVPEKFNWSVLLKNVPPLPDNGIHLYRYATAFPVAMLLAQTWNTDLLYRVGKAIGREMTDFGADVWLAPGMNIHRNPLCGRNFEYYSEDPLVTGKMAAAIVKGVQSFKGKAVAIKHFCCNNQEDNRTKVSSEVDEKALREIYLRGFEIAVKEANPKTVMSSYNRLNGVYTSNRKDLLTDILRCEWNFQGLVMTDWGTTNAGQADSAQCIEAGNDLIMPGNQNDTQCILRAIKEGRLSEQKLQESASRVLRLIRDAAVD